MDIFPRTRGRAAVQIVAAEVRELTAGDIALLADEKGSRAPALKRLSDRHHALARCLSSGMSEGDAAIACGYVSSRVSILKDDPAFKELLSFYRDETNEKYRDLHGHLAGISSDAAELLREQLERDLENEVEERKVSFGQLMEAIKLGADRTGHGPQSSSTNLNVNVDMASRLKAARQRASRGKIIESD